MRVPTRPVRRHVGAIAEFGQAVAGRRVACRMPRKPKTGARLLRLLHIRNSDPPFSPRRAAYRLTRRAAAGTKGGRSVRLSRADAAGRRLRPRAITNPMEGQ